MLVSADLENILHTVSQILKIPTIIVLLLMIALTVITAGCFIAEYFTERRRLKANIPGLMDAIQGKNMAEIEKEVSESRLLKRQKAALLELTKHSCLAPAALRSLARELLSKEEERYHKTTSVSDIIARLGPAFGLMGTLIPLGPGLIALGQGDTKTLADSLLTAFDTTVAGLASSAVCFAVSRVRTRWYEGYVSSLETIMECILEEVAKDEVDFKDGQVKTCKAAL